MNRRELLIGCGAAVAVSALPEVEPGLMAGLPVYVPSQPEVTFDIRIISSIESFAVGDWLSGPGLGACRIVAVVEAAPGDHELTVTRHEHVWCPQIEAA